MTLRDNFVLILMSILGSFSFVLTHWAVAHFPPFLFTALRFLIIMPLMLIVPRPKLPWTRLALHALLFSGMYYTCFNLSLSQGLMPGTAAIIMRSSQFFMVLFSVVLLHQKPPQRSLEGMVVCLVGVILICAGEPIAVNSTGMNALPLTGIALCFMASCGLALSLILGTREKEADALPLMVWSCGLSAIPMLLITCLYEGPQTMMTEVKSASPQVWACVAYLAFVAMLGAGAVWVHMMRRVGAARVAAFSALNPVFALILSLIFTDETMTLVKSMAVFLTLFGFFMTQSQGEKVESKKP